jgi:threonine synthase
MARVLRAHVRDDVRTGVFRWLPLLPIAEPVPGLPAGGTPLVEVPRLAEHVGLRRLFLKDETRNPTRCLKDRATAVGVSLAVAEGFRGMYCASAGNAAISLAGFCSQLGLGCHVFVPNSTPAGRLRWLELFGADVVVHAGDYDSAFAAAEHAGSEHGWYSRNCAFNPFLVEGKKTAALEIAEQLEWQAPDLVLAPVGDGCTLGGLGKGFRQLAALGLTDRIPRLVGSQAEGVDPLVRRFKGDSPQTDTAHATEAHSIAVRHPRNAIRVLNEISASGGDLISVPDDAMAEAQALLGSMGGVVAERASAASLAALLTLRESEPLGGVTAVVVVTGGRIDDDV